MHLNRFGSSLFLERIGFYPLSSFRKINEMKINRRKFIQIGGLSAVAAFVFAQQRAVSQRAATGEFVPATVEEATLFGLKQNHFRGQIGAEFVVSSGSASAVTVLTGVTDLLAATRGPKVRNSSETRESFVVTFRQTGNTGVFLNEQKVYSVFNAALGSFDLFLVPGESPAGEPTFVAVINRL